LSTVLLWKTVVVQVLLRLGKTVAVLSLLLRHHHAIVVGTTEIVEALLLVSKVAKMLLLKLVSFSPFTETLITMVTSLVET